MIEKETLSISDIEKVYALLHLPKPQILQDSNQDETFESIAASFRWPKMFYPSLYDPCKNNISSSASAIQLEK